MSLGAMLRKVALREWQRMPELLCLPNIPPPMHGVAPRTVLGTKWWDATRKAAYASTDWHCQACGVWVPKRCLEAHEVYALDYPNGRMTYLLTVPLCHHCHSFIHDGRLTMLKESGEITAKKYREIMQHGQKVLAEAGLEKPEPYVGKFAPWSQWRLVIEGLEFPPRFKTERAWRKHYGKGGK